MTYRTALAAIGAAVLLFAAACTDVPPTDPRGLEPAAPQLFVGPADPTNFGGTLDATFERIAREVPGFAGFHYDDAGRLTVVIAGAAPMALGEVRSRLGAHLQAIGHDAAAAQHAAVRPGDYDFLQLAAMHRRAAHVLGLRGTVFTDADEARNRVVIGVEDDAAAAAVERALGMLGLPREAVVLERSAPIVQDQTLRDHVRPVAGGLQIVFDRAGSTFICTHGFNVRAPGAPGVHGYVTNSHCSRERSAMLSTPYWQPSRVAANLIGEEVHDLPFFTGDPCPAGRVCRYSDSLGGRYEPGIDNQHGAIYRTLFAGTTNPGSLDIDPANPRWAIVGEHVSVVGQTLHKTGRTSGWTMGPVNATCQNTNLSPNITLLCQDRVTNLRQGGDSGSPYFFRIGATNDVHLAGLHWGGSGDNAVLSPIANIRFENQGPRPWITFPGQTPP